MPFCTIAWNPSGAVGMDLATRIAFGKKVKNVLIWSRFFLRGAFGIAMLSGVIKVAASDIS